MNFHKVIIFFYIKVIKQSLKHPLIDAGIETFKKDYMAVFGE